MTPEMKSNELLAAASGVSGHRPFAGAGLLPVLVLVALGYGGFRLTRHLRRNRTRPPVTIPSRPLPPQRPVQAQRNPTTAGPSRPAA